MKKFNRMFAVVLVLTALLISACGAASAAKTDGPVSGVGNGRGNASLVEFSGVIEAINGNQWTVNGQVITVDPAAVKDGPFNVGDTVKVQANVQADGSIVITQVETPSALVVGSTEVPAPTDDSLSTPQIESTPDPAIGSLIIDNGNQEAFGTVDSFDGSTIVIGGQSFTVANGAEIKDTITAGSFVKVEFILNADGSMSVQQIQLSDPATAGGDGSNSNGSAGSGANDGNGSHDQNNGANHDQNNDHGNDGSGHDQNDDHGGNDG